MATLNVTGWIRPYGRKRHALSASYGENLFIWKQSPKRKLVTRVPQVGSPCVNVLSLQLRSADNACHFQVFFLRTKYSSLAHSLQWAFSIPSITTHFSVGKSFPLLLWAFFSYHRWNSTKTLQTRDLNVLQTNQSSDLTVPYNPPSTYHIAQRISNCIQDINWLHNNNH